MEALISVIIPVYNVAPYLPRCVDSVLRQTHKNLEVILIDDGSSDESGRICDLYVEKDKRVRTIHKTNEGLACARNDGLDVSKGEWIAFLDADDWIEEVMYEKLLSLALSTGSEISSCKSRNCLLNYVPEVNDDGVVTVLSPNEIIRGLFHERVRFEVWDKLWKSSLIGDVRFLPGQISEEVYFDRILFLKANQMACLNCTLHNYLLSRPGNTNSSFKVNRLCIFDELEALFTDMESRGCNDIAKMVGCWGLDFAVSMYVSAKLTNQNEGVLQSIQNAFRNLYHRCKNDCEGRNFRKKNIAFWFYVSPEKCSRVLIRKKKIKVLLEKRL